MLPPLLLAALLVACGPRADATPTATGGIERVVMTATPEAAPTTVTPAPSATREPTSTLAPASPTTEPSATAAGSATTTASPVFDPALSEMLGFDFALPEGSTTLGGIAGMNVLIFESMSLAEAQRFVEEAMSANGYVVDPSSDPAAGRYTFSSAARAVNVRFADEVGRVTATFFPQR